MKNVMLAVLLAMALDTFGQATNAPVQKAPPPAVTKKSGGVDFTPELMAVTKQLQAKFDAGKTSKADLTENLAAIRKLIMKYIKDGNREEVARLYLLDAHIYADGLSNIARAQAIWAQVVRQFPGTLAAQGAAISLAKLEAKAAAEPGPNVPVGLAIGQKFPDFKVTDIMGRPLSVAAYRGRVTMIDFWATWCPPCRAEMPNVITTYNRYNAEGFNIVGVSLDEDRNAVLRFTQANGMTWPQYFDGQGWNNELAKKYGVNSIPMDYLLNRHGIIIGKGLRGEALQRAVAKAVATY